MGSFIRFFIAFHFHCTDAYFLQLSSTCFWRELYRKHFMATKLISVSVGDLSANCVAILTLCWVVTVSCKTYPQTRWKGLHIWNGTQHREIQSNDEYHKQYQWQRHHGWWTTGWNVQLQILGSTHVKRWHLQHRNSHMDLHKHSSDGQTTKDMEEQHQLPYQVQALQIAGRIHPPLRVWNGDSWLSQEKGSMSPIKKISLRNPLVLARSHKSSWARFWAYWHCSKLW